MRLLQKGSQIKVYGYTSRKKEDYDLEGRKRNRKQFRFGVVFLFIILFVAGFVFGRISHVWAAESSRPMAGVPGTAASSVKKSTNEAWMLALVNPEHPLDKGYQPPLRKVQNGYFFDARAEKYLASMLADAREEGLSPVICSAYRTIKYQTQLYEKQVKKQQAKGLSLEKAQSEACKEVAYPGTSEHHLGLAVDIVAKSYQLLDNKQAETPKGKWMRKNCSRYGFILRYPENKSKITGVNYEPWHFRYVGITAAAEIMAKGICLEEYLNK